VPYAQTLFALAKERNQAARGGREFGDVVATFESIAGLRDFPAPPRLRARAKRVVAAAGAPDDAARGPNTTNRARASGRRTTRHAGDGVSRQKRNGAKRSPSPVRRTLAAIAALVSGFFAQPLRLRLGA